MPLYVGTAQKRRRVKLLTAGDTIYKLTNTLGGQIDLRAVLNDVTNLKNHSLTWVQTKGNEVQLSSDNTLESSYVITDNTDKTFEFYIDKGLNTQQTKKVEIYYTPTSTSTPKRGTAFESDENQKTIPNFRFEIGAEFPEPTGMFNANTDIKVGTRIAFDNTADPFFKDKALRIRFYGEINEWTHNPTTLLLEEESVNKKIKNFFFVDNGSYAIEIDYAAKNITKEVTFRSEPVFAFDAGQSENLFRGIDEVIPCSTGTKVDLLRFERNINTKEFEESTGSLHNGFSLRFMSIKRRKNSFIKYVSESEAISDGKSPSDSLIGSSGQLSNGASNKLLSITRLDPSQIGSS